MDAVDSKKIPYDLYIEGETICSTQENSILRNLQSEEDKTGNTAFSFVGSHDRLLQPHDKVSSWWRDQTSVKDYNYPSLYMKTIKKGALILQR